jgi:purine-binding chemotaxis protein CheW
VALPAEDVESVIEIDLITPVPMAAPHVAGLFALRSRVLTIIDSIAALDLGVVARSEVMPAVIVCCDGHPYGLLVDQVDDVVAIAGPVAPVRAVLGQGWARAVRGVVEHEGEALLVVAPAALIAGPLVLAA